MQDKHVKFSLKEKKNQLERKEREPGFFGQYIRPI